MVLRPPFGLNNEYGGNFKGGCPLTAHAICGFSDPVHAFCWVPEAFPLLLNLKSWVQLVPTCSGIFLFAPVPVKREGTAFDLILRSTWRLSSPGKQVGRSSTPCRKRSQVWDRESERWPKYMQQSHLCWKWEEF